MALFFDHSWFDENLEKAGLSMPDVARALGLSEVEVAEMWKDQREISDQEIKTLALLLNQSEVEVKKRGGFQGSLSAQARRNAPQSQTHPEVSSDQSQLDRIEAMLEEVLRELKNRS